MEFRRTKGKHLFLICSKNFQIYLLDFGASREFSLEFVSGYLDTVVAGARQDKEGILASSIKYLHLK